MNLPAVAPTDIALRHDLLAACVFFQSRSVRSKMAITLARKASVFIESEASDTVRCYAAGFTPLKDDVSIMLALMPVVFLWKGTQFFLRGVPTRWDSNIQRTAECYLKSCAHEAPDEYCLQVFEHGPLEMSVIQIRLPGEIPVQPPEPKKRPCMILPCRHLSGWRIRAVDEGPSRRSQVLSEAIDYGLHWCPRFNIDRFKDGA